MAPPGSVLVVDASAEPERGYWGEILTTAAETTGITGLVIDGGVRDTTELRARGFPAFSRNNLIRGTRKLLPGELGVDVHIGGVTVHTGDLIVADADGDGLRRVSAQRGTCRHREWGSVRIKPAYPD